MPETLGLPWLAIMAAGWSFLTWLGFRQPKSPEIIFSSARSDLISDWFFSFVPFWFGVILSSIAWRESLRGAHHVWLFALLFLGSGAWFCASAVRGTRERRRYGARTLYLKPYPAYAGGAIGGHLFLTVPRSELSNVSIALCCQQGEEQPAVDGGTETFWTNVWREQVSAELISEGLGTRITFTFRPPSELQPSESSKIKWAFHLSADGPSTSFTDYYRICVEPPLR